MTPEDRYRLDVIELGEAAAHQIWIENSEPHLAFQALAALHAEDKETPRCAS